MGVEVNSTPERSNFVRTVFDQSYFAKNVNKYFFRRKNPMIVYILLLKYRTHEIMQMEITVRICSFPERSIVLKTIDR